MRLSIGFLFLFVAIFDAVGSEIYASPTLISPKELNDMQAIAQKTRDAHAQKIFESVERELRENKGIVFYYEEQEYNGKSYNIYIKPNVGESIRKPQAKITMDKIREFYIYRLAYEASEKEYTDPSSEISGLKYAVIKIDKVASINPDNTDVYYMKGKVSYRLYKLASDPKDKNYYKSQAASSLERYIQLEPNGEKTIEIKQLLIDIDHREL